MPHATLSRTLLLIAGVALSGQLAAAQFTMNANTVSATNDDTDAGGVASWSGAGANDSRNGIIGDGGLDAFDGYGYLANLGSLTVVRNTQVFAASNTVRWLDIFTNPTAASITQTVRFYGDLGSDGTTVTVSNAGGVLVSTDGAAVADPAIAHVSGTSMAGVVTLSASLVNGALVAPALVNNYNSGVDDYLLNMTMTIGAGQSIGIMHFVGLAHDAAGATRLASDAVLAQTMGTNLTSNPLLTGLSQAQLNTIKNFVVPEPATLALLAIAGCGIAAWRRRSLAHA